MSMRKALELGLEVRPVDPKSDAPRLNARFNPNGKRMPSVGTAAVTWWWSRHEIFPPGLPLKVHVVAEELPWGMDIALGLVREK
jgi:hypothetical protein